MFRSVSRQSTQCDSEESHIQGTLATVDYTSNALAATLDDKEADISHISNNDVISKPATSSMVKISLNPPSQSAH